MSDGVYDPQDKKLKLEMMLSKGLFPNPDGSVTKVSEAVAASMLSDIHNAGKSTAVLEDDGLDYETPAP